MPNSIESVENPSSTAQMEAPVSPIVLPPLPAEDSALRAAALRFLRWAHQNSLLSLESFFPGDEYDVAPVFYPPANAGFISTLRSKHVRQVGINLTERRITVFLSRTLPSVKALAEFPKTSDGFNLRFQQGDSESVNPTAVAATTVTSSIHQVNGRHFYTCGSSISVGNIRAAGTLGCLLRDAGGQMYGLSNSHVSAGCGNVPAGMPIVAPGVVDVHPMGPFPFTIGLHSRQLDMSIGDPSSVDTTLNQDAAIFKIVNEGLVSSMQRDAHDTPTLVGDLVHGLKVEKAGRTSGFTQGVVIAELVGPVPVNYRIDEYGFSGAIYFEPMYSVHGITDRFSEAGDSGSLVTAFDSAGVRYAVGIVVAGLQDSRAPGKVSLVMPLRPILNKMALSLVSAHNV